MLDKWLEIFMTAFKLKKTIIETKNSEFEFRVFKFKNTSNEYMII